MKSNHFFCFDSLSPGNRGHFSIEAKVKSNSPNQFSNIYSNVCKYRQFVMGIWRIFSVSMNIHLANYKISDQSSRLDLKSAFVRRSPYLYLFWINNLHWYNTMNFELFIEWKDWVHRRLYNLIKEHLSQSLQTILFVIASSHYIFFSPCTTIQMDIVVCCDWNL